MFRSATSEIVAGVQDLRAQLGELTKDVQALAHDLHPSKLEYLGAVAGMNGWSKDFAERYGLEIDFTADLVVKAVNKLREMSPLYEMAQQGVDLSTVQWAAH